MKVRKKSRVLSSKARGKVIRGRKLPRKLAAKRTMMITVRKRKKTTGRAAQRTLLKRTDSYNKAYDSGFDAAYNEGFNIGYAEGMEAGHQEAYKGE